MAGEVYPLGSGGGGGLAGSCRATFSPGDGRVIEPMVLAQDVVLVKVGMGVVPCLYVVTGAEYRGGLVRLFVVASASVALGMFVSQHRVFLGGRRGAAQQLLLGLSAVPFPRRSGPLPCRVASCPARVLP